MTVLNATQLQPLPVVRLVRNVSSNYLSLIPIDVRADYRDKDSMGVYTEGAFGGQQVFGVAVSGMASCGGLILATNTHYLAIHLGGDARAIEKFRTLIQDWRQAHQGGIVVGATGPSGSEQTVTTEFERLVALYCGLQTHQFDIYTNCDRIGVTNALQVGILNVANVQPVNRQHGSCCTIL